MFSPKVIMRQESKESFENKLYPDPNTGCWLSFNKAEYGPIRRSFKLFNGPIPEGQWVLHSCDTPSCCNPMHLRLGDRSQNGKDIVERNRCGMNVIGILRAKTHCKRGHELSLENLVTDRSTHGGKVRRCKLCRIERK